MAITLENRIPSMEALLGLQTAQALVREHGRGLVLEAVREAVGELRRAGTSGQTSDDLASRALAAARARLEAGRADRPRPVMNLTGTVLHTNLGRAPLPREALEAVAEICGTASSLEYDLARGRRGDRNREVVRWLVRLTGAEAATVVNNNAAAVLLVLRVLACRKDALISRGELVEIGGAFRIPDVMRDAGARLREVGTTNRTHVYDYDDAISPRAGVIMRVHASNYRIEGYAAAVPDRELAGIARRAGLPFVVDLGSGSLVDLARHGLPHEPTPREAIAAGADLVTFSADKLLGGPQAGLIVGRRPLIERLERAPLMRALRCGKLTIAALGATLPLYADAHAAWARIPALRLLTRPQRAIAEAAARLQPALQRAFQGLAQVEAVDCASQIGSGAMPVELLPSAGLRITPLRRGGRRLTAGGIAARLRALPVPVIGRIHKGVVLLDLRCLESEACFLSQVEALGASLGQPEAAPQ